MSLDYSGEHGGQLMMAFAAGCVACFGFCSLIGKFLWSVLGKAKDEQIASLTKTIEKDHERCEDMIEAQQRQLDQLQMILFQHSSGALRQDLQKVISEDRVEVKP